MSLYQIICFSFYETDHSHKSLGAFFHSLSPYFMCVPSTEERNEENKNIETSMGLGQYALPSSCMQYKI